MLEPRAYSEESREQPMSNLMQFSDLDGYMPLSPLASPRAARNGGISLLEVSISVPARVENFELNSGEVTHNDLTNYLGHQVPDNSRTLDTLPSAPLDDQDIMLSIKPQSMIPMKA